MKRLLLIALALTAVFTLASCKDEPEQPPDIDRELPPVEIITPTPEPTPTPTPEPTPYDGPRNPLSGLPIDEKSVTLRPMAIVVNNRKVALPQLGVSKADIIVEVPVEAPYTRMVAIFQELTDAGDIGSIRSARPYLIDIADSFDAIFIHAGGSDDAYIQLKSRKTDHFDETHGPGSSMYYRDAARKKTMGLEHSLILSSGKVEEQIVKQGYRREHEADYTPPLLFEDELVISGEAANKIEIDFGSKKSTSFEYNEEDGLYLASQQGGDYIDGNTKEQLVFANVIVIKTSMKILDKAGRLRVDLTSGGDGWLAIGGKYEPVTWSKASSSEPFVFRDASGSKVTLRTGKTYIAIIPSSAEAVFSEE